MGFMDSLFGKKPSTQQLSSLSPSQQDVDRLYSEWLTGGLVGGATPYGGQMVAGIPSMFTDAYKALAGTMGGQDIQAAMAKAISGQPAWQSDLGTYTKQFKEQFATPMMEMWRSEIAPLMAEQYNAVPGAFYSTARARGVTRAGEDYFARNIQPQFWGGLQADLSRQFQSGEAAAARVPQALQLPGAMFGQYAGAAGMLRGMEQEGLSTAYQEAMRMAPENSPYARLVAQYLGTPMTETIATPGTSGLLGSGGSPDLASIAMTAMMGPAAYGSLAFGAPFIF
jgi:hypothetical protein